MIRWLNETSHKATHSDDIWILRGLDEHLRGVVLADINRDKLDEITDSRLSDGVKNATVNRMLAVIRAILRRAAYEWSWIEHVPKIRMLPLAKRRIRFLTQSDAQTLIAELPKHLADMVLFSLETGLRKSNVTGLQWSQIDLARQHPCAWIHPDQAKAGKAIAVPLSLMAVNILREQLGNGQTYVFSYKGRPINFVNNSAWRAALERAGIKDFRWHDLRHTWASWHAQRGTPLNVLQELGGWESVEMVRRYAHLNSDHLAVYAHNMAAKLRKKATF